MSDERIKLWDRLRQVSPQWLPSDAGGFHVFQFALTVEERETVMNALCPLNWVEVIDCHVNGKMLENPTEHTYTMHNGRCYVLLPPQSPRSEEK